MSEFSYTEQGFELDGRWFPVAFDPEDIPEQHGLDDDDIELVALEHDLPPAYIDAIRSVESSGSGFLLKEPAPARPKILFEGHWFYKLTPQPVSRSRPDLSYRSWTRAYYKGGSAEWDRLRDACGFDMENALKSASWGLGQVMGANYKLAGCDSIEQMVLEAFSGEREQLNHMVSFLLKSGAEVPLKGGDWARVARIYNGPGYKKNAYDTKLAHAARTSKFA